MNSHVEPFAARKRTIHAALPRLPGRLWCRAACAALACGWAGCQKPANPGVEPAPLPAAQDAGKTTIPVPPAVMDDSIVAPIDMDEPERWLFVEKAREGVRGAWATGSFLVERNKLDIQTQDVQQFAIDTSRVPIDWSKLVIIGIDGVNSELRQRDFSIYHFARDEHGRWVVVEP